MKIFQILDNVVHYDMTELYESVEDARSHYSSEIQIVEAPDYVFPQWGYDPNKTGDERFIRPVPQEGWAYDELTGNIYNPESIQSGRRAILHQETTNDTLQALRKLREGDKTIDWQAWLDALDAYNIAIEKTKEQEGYPLKVTYPEYPTRPTS